MDVWEGNCRLCMGAVVAWNGCMGKLHGAVGGGMGQILYEAVAKFTLPLHTCRYAPVCQIARSFQSKIPSFCQNPLQGQRQNPTARPHLSKSKENACQPPGLFKQGLSFCQTLPLHKKTEMKPHLSVKPAGHERVYCMGQLHGSVAWGEIESPLYPANQELTCLSKRPGLFNAGSSVSAKLVAAITITPSLVSNPSYMTVGYQYLRHHTLQAEIELHAMHKPTMQRKGEDF